MKNFIFYLKETIKETIDVIKDNMYFIFSLFYIVLSFAYISLLCNENIIFLLLIIPNYFIIMTLLKIALKKIEELKWL